MKKTIVCYVKEKHHNPRIIDIKPIAMKKYNTLVRPNLRKSVYSYKIEEFTETFPDFPEHLINSISVWEYNTDLNDSIHAFDYLEHKCVVQAIAVKATSWTSLMYITSNATLCKSRELLEDLFFYCADTKSHEGFYIRKEQLDYTPKTDGITIKLKQVFQGDMHTIHHKQSTKHKIRQAKPTFFS